MEVSPFSRPVYLMAKPAGSQCNLACTYCYYTEKSKMYAHGHAHLMTDEVLEQFVRQYIEMQTTDSVIFTWHGGETLLRPLSFYKKALELQRKYAAGRRIENCLQTNGTLITDEWARFFKENDFLVGVSIDGPKEFHDEYRRSRAGVPSWRGVMQGIRLLNKHDVQWNALAVVNDYNAEYPLEFYRFFKQIGCRYLQFTPVVERIFRHSDGRELASPIEGGEETVTDFSVSPEAWGDFLCAIFDEWVRKDVGTTFVQLFDATLSGWMGVLPGVCVLAETCGHAGAVEWNGDVYACDHFVFPEFRLGNLTETPLLQLMNDPAQLQFGANKRDLLTRQCRECEWLFACHGECPRLRFARSDDGERGHNYLCAGYRKFFAHVAPYMDFMKHRLQRKMPPADVMRWIAQGMPAYQ